MFMRVNARCAHQLRPPLRSDGEASAAGRVNASSYAIERPTPCDDQKHPHVTDNADIPQPHVPGHDTAQTGECEHSRGPSPF
jgi:hypothetical protein